LGLSFGVVPPVAIAVADPSGNNLQADASSFKLKDTSAKKEGHFGPAFPAGREEKPPAKKPSHPKEESPVPGPVIPAGPEPNPREVSPPAGDLPPPVKAEASPVDPPVVPPRAESPPALAPVPAAEPARATEPEVPVAAAELTPMPVDAPDVLHQGAIPMTRSWKMFGLQTVLAAVLATAPTVATAAEKKDKIKDLEDRLDKVGEGLTAIQLGIQKDIGILDGKVKKLEKQLADLQETLEEIRKDLGTRRRTSAYPRDPLEDIARRLARLERALLPRGRVAQSPPEVGRILLTNNYSDDITFVVNRRMITLAPGSSRLLDGMPAGRFTYEVIWGGGAGGRRTRTLTAGDTYRISVD
jgi:hypothetical protein